MSREIKFRAWDKDENRMIHSGTEQNDYPFYGLHEESFEVIGNIYENAELLK